MGISSKFLHQPYRAWMVALAWSGLSLGVVSHQALAVTFRGSTHFAGVPRLVSAETTRDQARTFGGHYYFIISIPEDASEALGQIVIQPEEEIDRFNRFNLDDTVAFQADNRKIRFAIDSVEVDDDNRNITVTFEPGIEPGQTIQLGLRPRLTPSSGVYLFGVTAVPAGENPRGQFLGYGRLHFYDNNDSQGR